LNREIQKEKKTAFGRRKKEEKDSPKEAETGGIKDRFLRKVADLTEQNHLLLL
jgi:hypothetical protein